ncbi:MAG: site-2 protease family protein [Crocinitomicaceae bacterium]|nr:site-2 protease family protein [Crocinitomicaceae bacterium]
MEDFDFFPSKPELVEQQPKTGLSLTVFSMVLFVLVFMLVLGDEVSFIIYLLIVLIIHELGHFLTMKLFKYKNVRMLFIPLMGAFVQGTKSNYSQKQSFIVTVAGPFPGIIIGALLMWYGSIVHSSWMMELSSLFLMLNVINLLPLDPLDGGQMFKLFMRKNHELFLMIFAFASSIVMIGIGWMLDSYIIMIFGFFMGFRVRAMQKRYQMHKDLKEENVDYFTTYKLLSNKDFSKIKRVVIAHTPALQKYIDQVSEDESNSVIASQVNNVLDAPLKRDASLFFKASILLFWLISFLTPLALFFLLDLKWYFDAI